ncbi:MAG: hypothetical protein AAGM36_16850 [Cyanobacteria bacterium J06597_1]
MATEREPDRHQPTTQSVGDRIRNIADRLQTSHVVQVKATSRMLGAAAQLAQNHDRLIEEVSEMVQEDLQQTVSSNALSCSTYTVEILKQQFTSLKAAKQHFGVSARGWAALADKLNTPNSQKIAASTSKQSQRTVSARLDAIEQELQHIRLSLATISEQLSHLIPKKR